MIEFDSQDPPQPQNYHSYTAEIAAFATLGVASTGLAIYGITRLWHAMHNRHLQAEQVALAARMQRGATATDEGLNTIQLPRDNPIPFRLRDNILDFLDDMVAKPRAAYTVEHLDVWDRLREWQASKEGVLMEKPIIDSRGVVWYPLTGFEVPENAILPIRGMLRVRPGGIYGDSATNYIYGLVPMSLQTILQTERRQHVSDREVNAIVGKISFIKMAEERRIVDPLSPQPKDPWFGRLRKQRKYPIPNVQPRYIYTRQQFGRIIEANETSR